MERNKVILSKRKPQSKEECRVKAEKADILTTTILSVEKIILENKIPPENIWNIDETPVAYDSTKKQVIFGI